MDQTAQTPAPTPAPTGGKVIEVEPADAGPDVKPVRQRKPLTEAQKAALQKGRERLAERRKQMKESSEITEPPKKEAIEASGTESDSSLDTEQEKEISDVYDEDETTAYCTVM